MASTHPEFEEKATDVIGVIAFAPQVTASFCRLY